MELPKTAAFLLALCIILLSFASCKDDSTSSAMPIVEITDGSYTVIEINDCDIGGDPATEFLFELIYNASSDIDIDGVEFDDLFSSGQEIENNFEDDLDVSGNSLSFDWCYRFGSNEWVELTLKILAENEQVESNEYTLRVDRPEGANKSVTSGKN